MLDAKNMVVLTGNLVADMEVMKSDVIRGALAVSFAGSDNNETGAGFFDFVMFSNASNHEFVKRQIDNGKMGKSANVSIVGKLMQERYTDPEGKKSSRIKIFAESISYAGSGQREGADSSPAEPAPAATIPTDW
jgi:single-stranded DNA-binding protein